jgi:hypothetical protein
MIHNALLAIQLGENLLPGNATSSIKESNEGRVLKISTHLLSVLLCLQILSGSFITLISMAFNTKETFYRRYFVYT